MQITKSADNPFPSGWGKRTFVMGIINITPDSFSDGGDYYDLNSALLRTADCINQGADIIDIGAQSTRPGAFEVGSQEELIRLTSLIKNIKNDFPEILLSVDTFHSHVAENVLNLGVNWINDISGGRHDPKMFRSIAKYNCPYVITHSRGNSRTMNQLAVYKDVVNEVIKELELQTKKAIESGVDRSNIIWDPGIGFAKKTIHNIEILRRLDILKSKKYPLLIGASRKRFIGDILSIKDPKERGYGSAAITSKCVSSKVDIIRTHDVKNTVDVLKISDLIF